MRDLAAFEGVRVQRKLEERLELKKYIRGCEDVGRWGAVTVGSSRGGECLRTVAQAVKCLLHRPEDLNSDL